MRNKELCEFENRFLIAQKTTDYHSRKIIIEETQKIVSFWVTKKKKRRKRAENQINF